MTREFINKEFASIKRNANLKKLALAFIGGLGIGSIVNHSFNAGVQYGQADACERIINEAEKESE